MPKLYVTSPLQAPVKMQSKTEVKTSNRQTTTRSEFITNEAVSLS